MGNKTFSVCNNCSVYNKYVLKCGKPPTAEDQRLQLIESLEQYNLHYLADVIVEYLPDVSYGIVPIIPLKTDASKYCSYFHPHVSSFNSKCMNADNDQKIKFLSWKKYIKSFGANPWDAEVKCVMFGNAEIGKTALIERFEREEFITDYRETINDSRNLALFVHKQNRLNMNLIDTAGIKEFLDENMRVNMIKHNDFFLCCFAMNDEESYNDIMDTIDVIRRNKFDDNDFEYGIILVALKCDLDNGIEVDRNVIVSNCKKMNIPYIETSAKLDINVNCLFYQILYELWIQRYINSMMMDDLDVHEVYGDDSVEACYAQ